MTQRQQAAHIRKVNSGRSARRKRPKYTWSFTGGIVWNRAISTRELKVLAERLREYYHRPSQIWEGCFVGIDVTYEQSPDDSGWQPTLLRNAGLPVFYTPDRPFLSPDTGL